MSSMIVLVIHDLSQFDELLDRWHDAGAPALTMFDCVGTRGPREQGERDDLPLMPTIRDLLQSDDAPRKMIFSIVPDDAVDPIVDATVDMLGDPSEEGKGILFVLPVARVIGLRLRKDEAAHS